MSNDVIAPSTAPQVQYYPTVATAEAAILAAGYVRTRGKWEKPGYIPGAVKVMRDESRMKNNLDKFYIVPY